MVDALITFFEVLESSLKKYCIQPFFQYGNQGIIHLVRTRSTPEAVIRRCSVNKAFSKILQNSQKHTCARDSFLIKLQA